jgi:hypothetical protein
LFAGRFAALVVRLFLGRQLLAVLRPLAQPADLGHIERFVGSREHDSGHCQDEKDERCEKSHAVHGGFRRNDVKIGESGL